MTKFTDLSLTDYLSELSSEKPIPGGGSASAYTAALGMGLTQMVARVSLKRKPKAPLSSEEEKKYHEKQAALQKTVDAIEKIKRDALEIVNLDPQMYQEVINASKTPQKMEDALQNSFRLQADLAMLAAMAYEWNAHLMDLVTGSIKNDLLVSAAILRAAFYGASRTAEINVKSMKNEERKKQAERALGELRKRMEGK